jgi:hypothetical protein
MTKILIAIATVGWATAAQAAGAPDALKAKTVTITWSETREQAAKGGEFKFVTISAQMSVYVSSAGRPFAKLTMRSRSDEASQGTVGGSGASLGGGVRTVNFTPSGFTIGSNFGGAARRIVVDASGGGCSASVSVAKLAGASTVSFTRTDGRSFELRSLSASGANCSISNSNDFAK